MKTKTINLYEFSELTPAAQQKALDNLRETQCSDDWWRDIYADAENIGLKITSFDLDRNNHATGEFMIGPVNCAERIVSDHGPDCTTRKTAEAFLEAMIPLNQWVQDAQNNDTIDTAEDAITEEEGKFLKALLKDYAKLLQEDMEYRMSDECIKEDIDANEWTFTENGKLENA